MNNLLQALFYGLSDGGAMIPLTLGIWLIYAVCRSLSFSVLGSYVCAALVLAWTPDWALFPRVALALPIAAAFGGLSHRFFHLFRQAGADEATQIITGLVVVELMLVLATGLGLSEPTWVWEIPGAVWFRGALGILGLFLIGGLLWARLGHSLRRVIDAPLLSAELGILVSRVELAAYLLGGLLCGASALLDSIDPAIGAGPRNLLPAAIQAAFAILLGVSFRGYSGFVTVAVATVAVSMLGAAVAYLLPGGERLVCPALLVGWLLIHPSKDV